MSTPDIPTPVPVVRPEPDSRLEQLCAQYDLAKAEADKATEALKAITDGIKFELSQAMDQGQTKVDLESPDLARPFRFEAVESWRVDATKLKREQPVIYVQFAKKTTSWRLAPIGTRTS